MNAQQFAHLNTIKPALYSVSIADLQSLSDRTLLYGYTTERNTWHVFLHSQEIYRLVYNERENPSHPKIISRDHAVIWHRAVDLIPNKRLYPEACDFDFCSVLLKRGLTFPFTTFNSEREPRQFHGLI